MVDMVVDEKGCPGRALVRLSRNLGGIVISSRPKGRPRLEERGEGGCCGGGRAPPSRDQEGRSSSPGS